MNAGELRAALEGVPDDRIVILEKDAEGNGYSPLCGVRTNAIYVADSTWSGEVYPSEEEAAEWVRIGAWRVEDLGEYWDDEGERCVVLGPVN